MKHNDSLYNRFIRWAEGNTAAKETEETEEHAEFVEYLEYLDAHEYVDFSTYHHMRDHERADHGLPVASHTVHSVEITRKPEVSSAHTLNSGWLRRSTYVYRAFSLLLALFLMGTFLTVAINLPAFGDPNAPAVNVVSQRYLEKGLEETGAVNAVAGMILDYLNMIGGESDNLAFGADGFSHMSEEQECAYIASMTGRSAMLLGFIGGEMAAIASLEGKNRERAAHRGNLVITVRQKFWHRGIGTQMMNKLVEHAKAQGITVIETHVRSDNASALSLYEKLGFERIGTYRRFFRIGETDYDAELLNLYL